MRATRAMLGLLAVLGIAWFVLGAIQAHDTTLAGNIAGPGRISAAQARRADALLATAGTLNPDRQVTLERGLVARDRGQARRAQRTVESVTSAEPLNLAAWSALASVAGNDRALTLRAFHHIVRLVPPVHAAG